MNVFALLLHNANSPCVLVSRRAFLGNVKQDTTSGWIRTFSGIFFSPLDPRSQEIRIEDIGHAMAQQWLWRSYSDFLLNRTTLRFG